jgi:NitT/TauT family transport system permease protein
LAWQVLIVVAGIAGWEWIPTIPGVAHLSAIFNPFFVSSPSRVAHELMLVATGKENTPTIWSPFLVSMGPAVVGTALAIGVGSLARHICSNWTLLNQVVRPFLVLFNALPRITLIPIALVIAGPGAVADVAIGFLVVFFLVFFNAYEGGVSVPKPMLENMRVLGAGSRDLLWKVRWPFVLAWTFAQLPNAIAFGITAIVTTELFSGAEGLGGMLLISVQSANADLTVTVALVLAVSSLVLIGLGGYVRGIVLRWQ